MFTASERLTPNPTQPNPTMKTIPAHIKERLDYLKNEIVNERISYLEIAELQDLAEYTIQEGDLLLMQLAGVPEFSEEEEQS